MSNTFNKTTEKRLEGLFRILPEIFFWTVIVTRLFICVPLAIAATTHFDFLKYQWLIIPNAIVSVLIVESILTLPSLSTAFFKKNDMKRYQTTAFVTTIILGLFNQLLIFWAWRDINMGKEAFYMYTAFNVASITLAEFIGFMYQKKHTENINSTNIEIADRKIEEPTNEVDAIVMLNLPESEKIFKLNQAGLTQRKIAEALGTNPTRVNTMLKKIKHELEQTN